MTTTRREQLKADRRKQLLDAAGTLIAERGFAGLRLEDLGAAAGISGPAVYRHFSNKDAVLVELLVGISHRLLTGGGSVVDRASSPAEALNALVDFHLDFVFSEPDLIRIQDRDLASLPTDARRQVRRMQRRYVEIWVRVLQQTNPEITEADARIRAHATFGLLNSTPHSAGRGSPDMSRAVLRAMTSAALAAPALWP